MLAVLIALHNVFTFLLLKSWYCADLRSCNYTVIVNYIFPYDYTCIVVTVFCLSNYTGTVNISIHMNVISITFPIKKMWRQPLETTAGVVKMTPTMDTT